MKHDKSHNNKMIMINAPSGAFTDRGFTSISINDVEVPNIQNDHYRGFHIVIINPKNGKIE